MQKSLGRTLVELAAGAAVLNLVINLILGWLIFRHQDPVPLHGSLSAGGDTLIGAFLIACFTALGVMKAARREARAGRVRGRGGTAPQGVLGFLARRPGRGAVLFGLAVAVVLGGGTVAALDAGGATALPFASFLAFKALFAAAVGALAAVVAGWVGVAIEPPAAEDDRWWRGAQPPPGSDPFDYIDKGCLALTSAEHGCSGTPTWQLVVDGRLEPEHVRRALADVLRRYPSVATAARSLDGVPEYAARFCYAPVARPPSDYVDVVDLRGQPPERLAELVRVTHNRHTDLFRDPPLTLTMAITGDDTCRLLFRQHHALADGRAFIELLVDFAAFLNAARLGERPAASALEPVARLPELDALGLGALRRRWWTVAGYGWLVRAVCRALVRPLVPLVPNDSTDYTGANGTVHWVIADEALEAWTAARRRLGVSLNSLIIAALFAANQRWHRALGRRLGRTNASMVMETRPRDRVFRSFANHLATLEVDADLGGDAAPADLARRFQRQVARQRDRALPIKRLLCERHLVRTMGVDRMRDFVFQGKQLSYNLNLSNLIALDFPALGGVGWRVDEVLITTPATPRTGIVLTVIRYQGRLIFNFNYAESAATRAQTAELVRHFEAALTDLTGYRAVELDGAAPPVDAARASAA